MQQLVHQQASIPKGQVEYQGGANTKSRAQMLLIQRP